MRLLVLAAALVAAAALASTVNARASYCSPTGDYCISVRKTKGDYRFVIGTAAHYFARYRLCVRRAGTPRTCKSFPMRPGPRATWRSSVRWSRSFPNRGPGRYSVGWYLGARRLGQVLAFRVR